MKFTAEEAFKASFEDNDPIWISRADVDRICAKNNTTGSDYLAERGWREIEGTFFDAADLLEWLGY
jgi:hypothetical protein